MFSFSKNVASQYIAREYFENVFSWGSDIEKKKRRSRSRLLDLLEDRAFLWFGGKFKIKFWR